MYRKYLTGLCIMLVVCTLAQWAKAQDSLIFTLNQSDYTVDLAAGPVQSVSVLGSVFALSTNTADHLLDDIQVNEQAANSVFGSLKFNQVGAALTDDPTGYYTNFTNALSATPDHTLHPGTQLGSALIDTFTLDTTGVGNPRQLLGDYTYDLSLRETGGLAADQSFVLHVIDTSGGSPVPEVGSAAALLGMTALVGLMTTARFRARRSSIAHGQSERK